MSAIRSLMEELGSTTSSFRAMLALRIRASMSETGSVMTMSIAPSPRRLGHARDLTLVGELAKADAAQRESAVDGPGPPAPGTPRVGADAELLSGSPLLLDQCLLRHVLSSVSLLTGRGRDRRLAREREPQRSEEPPPLVVVPRRGHDGDVHP